MAQKVKLKAGKEFKFVESTSKGGQSVYPWDEWFDGSLLLLEQSSGAKDKYGNVTDVTEQRDYDVSASAMRYKLRKAARARYKVVQISAVDEHGKRLEGGLIIKARDMNAEERIAEDQQRVIDKQVAAEKLAERNAANNGSAS